MQYIIYHLDTELKVREIEPVIGFRANIESHLLLKDYLPIGGNLWMHQGTKEHVTIVKGI